MRMIVLCLGAILAIGCGGGNGPAGPSTPTPSTIPTPMANAHVLTFTDGTTGQAVAGASVEVDGKLLVADAAGQISAPVRPGSMISIEAAGYFAPRKTKWRGDDTFALWPRQDETFVRELSYSQDRTFGRMFRPSSTVYIVLPPELWNDPAVKTAQEKAAQLNTNANGGAIPFQVVDKPVAGGVNFTVSLNASIAPDRGRTVPNPNSNVIVGGTITYQTKADAAFIRTVAHEMGHAFGLNHPTTPGLMSGGYYFMDFTPEEKKAIRMMAIRLPGNRFAPDDDQDLP